MSGVEIPFTFACRGGSLVAIYHQTAGAPRRGVVIVVGGPQYRVGSHRQFILLARALAEQGIPALRFDYRGMGDSDGEFVGFEALDLDIAAAIDAFTARCPSLREIVLWGLCDAASASLFYAHHDARVHGLVLLNPWVRTTSGEARTYLKHYYTKRLLHPAFWRKLLCGRFAFGASLTSFIGTMRKARNAGAGLPSLPAQPARLAGDASIPLPDRMAEGLRRFTGPVLLIMSGNDLTAREFDEAAKASPLWRELLASPRVTRRDLPAADHTYSRRAWRDQVAAWTLEWLPAPTNAGGTRPETAHEAEAMLRAKI
jgi:exosortase A-associated hydrolase 1